MNRSIPALAALFCAQAGFAQIILQNTQTPEELVQNTLLGTGVIISNVTFNGQPGNTVTEQAGFFDGENCNVGIDYGVLLATGSIMNAAGPNNQGSASLGGGLFGQNDPDLIAISNVANINDAAVLEFDFTAVSDTVLFDFAFGSDEYLEFVNSGFNDVFGFFLSGPGISGPYMNNAINIALVPGTSIPISINSLNADSNATWFVNNGDGFTAPYNTDPQYIQYDGFTAPITIIGTVVPGETYHMKIAIGDAADTAFDSAVFLSGASFMSPQEISTSLADQTAPGPMILTSPNPASDRVRITCPAQGPMSIRACDALGREVLNLGSRVATNGMLVETLDVSNWSAGHYQVTATSVTGHVQTTTLVVAR